MPEDFNLARPSAAVPSHIQKISSDLKLFGRIGFWVQLVLGVISAVLLSFGTLILLSGTRRTEGIEIGIIAAIVGLGFLIVAIYFSRRYIQYSEAILNPNATERPKKADTVQLIKTGLMFNLIGMFFTIVGAEALVGIILQKSLLIPQATITADPNKFINSADVLIVQANTNTIAGHFAGLVCSLWLLNRIFPKI